MGLAADDPRISRVAYAKLEGDGFEYFVRKYEVLLGRKSKSTELDIVLGAPSLASSSPCLKAENLLQERYQVECWR